MRGCQKATNTKINANAAPAAIGTKWATTANIIAKGSPQEATCLREAFRLMRGNLVSTDFTDCTDYLPQRHEDTKNLIDSPQR